jgi:hypothetical protein
MTTMMTEAEARTALTAMWVTVQTTRQTIAKWALGDKKPTKDELLQLSLNIRAVEEAAMRRDLDVLQAVIDRAERSQ